MLRAAPENVNILSSLRAWGSESFALASSSCSASLVAVEVAARSGELWAAQMLDADGKIGAGVLQGNTKWLGRYSECRDKNVTDRINGTSFYLLDFNLAFNVSGLAEAVPSKLGACFPETCNNTDVAAISNTSFNEFNSLLKSKNISSIRSALFPNFLAARMLLYKS